MSEIIRNLVVVEFGEYCSFGTIFRCFSGAIIVIPCHRQRLNSDSGRAHYLCFGWMH